MVFIHPELSKEMSISYPFILIFNLSLLLQMPSLASTQWVISDFDITFRYGQLTRARGALLVTPDAPTVSGFKNWFVNRKTSLNPNDHPENPWFIDW